MGVACSHSSAPVITSSSSSSSSSGSGSCGSSDRAEKMADWLSENDVTW